MGGRLQAACPAHQTARRCIATSITPGRPTLPLPSPIAQGIAAPVAPGAAPVAAGYREGEAPAAGYTETRVGTAEVPVVQQVRGRGVGGRGEVGLLAWGAGLPQCPAGLLPHALPLLPPPVARQMPCLRPPHVPADHHCHHRRCRARGGDG